MGANRSVSISDILNELHTKEYITTYGTVISKNLIEDKVKSDFKALYERNGFNSDRIGIKGSRNI